MEDRPLETRQFDLLNDRLEAPRWEIHQAACLLAGVLPPERNLAGVLPPERTGSGDFGAWLPEQKPWQDNRVAWEFKVGGDIAHFKAVLKVSSRGELYRGRLQYELIRIAAAAFVNGPATRNTGR